MENITGIFNQINNWQPEKDFIKITTLDANTGGEPLRIITGGMPELKGNTLLECRRYMKDNYDYLRKALMWEPRGHSDQYGCVVLNAFKPEADFSVIFLHNEGYSTMCGHAIIALTKVMLETGAFEMQEPLTRLVIEVPSGLVTSYAECSNGKVTNVYFHNVPSFAPLLNQKVKVSGLGEINFDLSFGGAFYAYVNAEECKVKMIPEDYRNMIETGMAIKQAVMENYEIIHPFEKDLSFLYGTIFMGPALTDGIDSRNVCIFADGEVDRSPTGSGVAGRMALHYAKGEIKLKEKMTIESILGSVFTGSVYDETTFGKYKAVIPQVEGIAYINGKNEFYIDPADPLKHGFILR